MSVLPADRIRAVEALRPSPKSEAACAHCGLPVPQGRVDAGRDEQFCCGGCEIAFDTIRACGLGEYYALRDRLGANAEPAATRAEARFAEFDDPAFAERHVRGAAGGGLSTELYLQGVHCAACLWLVERLPSVVPGLLSAELDLGRHVATMRWDPAQVRLSVIATALSKFGYLPHAVEPSVAREARRAEDRQYLIRIGIAAACAGNVMLLAFALYSGHFSAMEERWATTFRWLSAALGMLAVFGPGKVFMTGAIAAVRTRTWHLDMPIALALAVGALAGLANVVRGAGEIYFDSLAMLVFLLLIGRWLQMRQQQRATDAVELLFSVTPRRALLVDGGVTREVSIDAVHQGDLVEVPPQQCVPVDGVIEGGSTSLDESILTGESRPSPRGVGDAVTAGAVNLGSTIRVRVSAAGRATRVGRLMGTIEKMSRSRAPIIGSADRIAGPFVVAVLALSALCFVVRLGAGVEAAVESTVALLIVCCPCAIALSTPLACAVAIGRLASRGTLVKGGQVFEALSRPARLVLDKTGTVTEGLFRVRAWTGDEGMRPVVAALEAGSPHPLALALAECEGGPAADVVDIEHRLGLGAVGRYSGERVAAGSSRLMAALGVETPDWATESAREASERGQTAVFVSRGDRVEAVATLGDEIRADARGSIATLEAAGWSAELLSGDDPVTTARVAARVGLERHTGHADPERKAEHVRALAKEGAVIAVGDGVNDAAALASATVGVAVHGGAEASLAAADVYLSRPGLAPLVELRRVARGTTNRIRLCLAVAGTYNLAAAALSIGGLISPVLAAVLMPISSLTVLTIAAGSARKETR